MAQLNDTLVNGDLRVNGKIYGIITSADSATNASNLGSTAASDFALKNGNYSSNGLVAKSASTAARANAALWTEKSDDRTYRVAFSQDAQFYFSQQFNYNAGTQTLCAKNISSVNITGTVSGNLSGSATSALTSKSALSAGYATSAGAAPVASHNHNYQLSGNGTALYISAGVNLKPNGNIAISTAANTINISAKDTTYTSLNSINSTEYKALTSTSANSRNPNAHQLSSHTNFSTYFDGTSAKSALTSKSALSAGSAAKAAELTNKAIKVNSAGTADYATSAGAAPFISHNHNYQLSGNGTALYISAGVNLKPNGNIAISTAANTINISAKDTTYSTLNSINSTEYKALTSTSANSRNPNAHELSSHTHFSTYFNGTSANTALTAGFATQAGDLYKQSIGFSRTVAQGGDGKKWCRIASISRPKFTTASDWGSCEAELNIYTKSYGEYNTVDRGKIVLYCRWGHNSASTPTYSMKTNGSRGARWLYWKPQATSTSVSADSAVSAYTPFKGLKNVDIKIVATDTSVEWWLYNDVWDTRLEIIKIYSDNITLYGKDSPKTLGEFKTYLEDNRSQWDDAQGDGTYIDKALSAYGAYWVGKSDNRNYNVAFSLDNAFNYRNTLTFNPSSNTLSSTNINTVTLSGTTVKGVTISGTNITAATTVRGTNLSGTNISGATKTMTVDNLISSATRTLPTVNNNTITISTGASPATASFTLNQNSNKTITLGSMALKASGDFSLTSHNHSYTLSGNGTAVNVSAGVNFKPSGSNIKFYVSGNDIYISAKNDNTTYTTLNSINSTEYKALTSTSANKRDPNAHQLSSHTNFSTYFDGTSAKSALTSKSALSAGSAQKSYSSYWSKADDNTDLDRVIGCGLAGGSASWTAGSEFYGTVTYDTAFTFNSKSNTMKVINVSATSVTGVSLSGTNIIGDIGKFLSAEATTAVFNNTSSINLSGTNITATTFSGNLSGSAASALTSKSALTAGYASTTNTAIKVNSAIYVQDFGDTSRYIQVSWGGQDVSSVKIGAGASRNKGTQYLAAFYTNDGSTTSNMGKIKPVDVSHVQVASADTVDGLHVATGTIGTATNYLYFC